MQLTTKQKIIGGSVITAIAGLTAFILIRKSRKSDATVNKSFDKSTITTGGATVNVIETARSIANDLGTAYSWYDPRHATENDNAVLQTLLKFPKYLIPLLRIEYAKITNRNLQVDLQNLLDDYAKVRYLFV